MFARALQLLGTRRAFVVHGHDGMDEITVCDKTRVSELNNNMVLSYDIDPLDYFDDYHPKEALKGGDVETNADITRAVLDGEKGARREIVLLNAAAALVAADAADTITRGITMAEAAIDSGRAAGKLAELITFTRENG